MNEAVGIRMPRTRAASSVRPFSPAGVCLVLGVFACAASEDDYGSDWAWNLATQQEDVVRQGGGSSALDVSVFEADPVRPIAVLEQSGVVAVTNTVDGRLELLKPTRSSLGPCGSLPVGLGPVAVAVVAETHTDAELWVVNHISDSVSVVHVDPRDCRAEVRRTLPVGDEPRDIVVALDSQGRERVFVATAHRGQRHPVEAARLGTDLVTPPELKTERGLGDVLVFDAADPSAPARAINLFSDKPRALAVGDGVVYAASFFSGNATTSIPAETVTLRGLASLNGLLARDADGRPIEQGDELVLAPEAQGRRIEGGLPAVAGSGRCLADPRAEDNFAQLGLCAQTDAEGRVERVIVQRAGSVHPDCQCTSGDGTLQPATGVIVRFFAEPAACGAAWTTFPDGSQGCWLDALPGGVRSPARASERQAPALDWSQQVKLSLPDQDVFAIGVDDLRVSRSFSGVGTILFGLTVQPQTGKLFVTNTDAQNLTRFEGHGQSSSTSVIGHLHESHITVIDPSRSGPDAVQPVHLNSHIDYARCCEKDPEENAKSFAFPTAGVFSADGSRFYFSALGSDKLGSVSASALGAGFDHDAVRAADELRDLWLGSDVAHPSGPVGLALDARRERLYVKTHFDNQLVVIDAGSERISGRVQLPSPEPASVRRGRSVLYNARLTSSHGDSACASCHVFGDVDGLAWDLGDPDGMTVTNPGPFALPDTSIADFRSNKGPMVTQTLRGLANHGPLHWRGDRTRRFQTSPGEQPDFGSFDEANSFGEFDVAIAGLNGNDGLLDPAVFEQFTQFALQLSLPPNPIRHLDDTLTPDQAAARALYFGCASMSDAEYAARSCVGVDGSEVAIEPATADCLCARNFFVDGLRLLPEVRGFAELLGSLYSEGELRARLETLASNTGELPEGEQAGVARAAAEFAAGNSDLLLADPTPATRHSLLSPSLAAALSRLSRGLSSVLEASAANGTDTRGAIAAALFEAVPTDALPPELPRDADGAQQIFETLAEVAQLSEFAREDELARGTSAFRNVLSGCELGREPVCKLRVTDGALTCHGCHRLDPQGNAELDVFRPGFFGTDGTYSFEGESQVFKIPQLRNQYQKAGMFGAPSNPFFLPESVLGPRSGGFFAPDTRFMGPQIRGFGFFHDGVADTLFRFHGATAFVRSPDNADAFDAFLPRPAERAACVQRFRQAPSTLFDAAAEELRPFLGLCIESGPLPESCFLEPGTETCRAALAAAGSALGFEPLPEVFADGVLPLCFQLGSMAEGGSPDGVCYPEGLRERAQMESFMLAFDTNLKPMVGQQLTLADGSRQDPGLAPLLGAARRGDCDLTLSQGTRQFLMVVPDPDAPGDSRLEDRRGRVLDLDELAAQRGALTFTCHPPAPDRAQARRAAFWRDERGRPGG